MCYLHIAMQIGSCVNLQLEKIAHKVRHFTFQICCACRNSSAWGFCRSGSSWPHLKPFSQGVQRQLGRVRLLGEETLDRSRTNEGGNGHWTVATSCFCRWPSAAAITRVSLHFRGQGVICRSSCWGGCWYSAWHWRTSAGASRIEIGKTNCCVHSSDRVDPFYWLELKNTSSSHFHNRHSREPGRMIEVMRLRW